jgi:5-methylcytosine-specific restriction endonuclease McrA
MGYYFQESDETSKLIVWQKGQVILGYDSRVWRRDMCGKVMRYSDHGETTEYGWEIDHILPVSKGGTDHFSNLQPLHWANNRVKSDKYSWA